MRSPWLAIFAVLGVLGVLGESGVGGMLSVGCASMAPVSPVQLALMQSAAVPPATAPSTQPGAPAATQPSGEGVLTEREKIEKLLAHIESLEGASFIRNGVAHSAREAAGHLRTKLRAAGSRIRTADAFISQLATKSSITGEPYRIRLASGREVEAGPYLREQLKTLSAPADPAPAR